MLGAEALPGAADAELMDSSSNEKCILVIIAQQERSEQPPAVEQDMCVEAGEGAKG